MKKNRLFQFLAVSTLILTCGCTAHAQEKKEESGCKGCQNAVIENIMTRTSIRKFEAKAVEQDKIETMLRAGMAAPTAVNRQPWHFVVINDKEIMAKLAGDEPRGQMKKDAPLAIIVCGDMDKALEGEGQQFWVQDTSLASENILLAAHALGLGAVWTALYPDKKRYEPVRKILGMPENIIPLNMILIGYPAEKPTPKDKWKPENVSYNKY